MTEAIPLPVVNRTGIQDNTTTATTNSNISNIKNENNDSIHLPVWIHDYFAWHSQMRTEFPDTQLLTNPNAPGVLVRACPFICGGLHDRIGQLPWDLYIANRTQRVLLFKWHLPASLEQFLLPSGPINWTVPDAHDSSTSTQHAFGSLANMWKVYPNLFPDSRADEENAIRQLEMGVASNSTLSTDKIVLYSFLGHKQEALLERLLRDAGVPDNVHQPPVFGAIFRSFFQPSPAVVDALQRARREVGLVHMDGSVVDYTGVHCRVRHPKNFPSGRRVRGKDNKGPADRVGLEFKGWGREYAINVSTHALQCGRTLLQSPNEPVYFFSDDSQVVNYFVRYLKKKNKTKQGNNSNNSGKTVATSTEALVEAEAQRVVNLTNLVARRQQYPNVHLDRQKDAKMEAYISVFVDLYLAIGARCLVFGVGNFGYFASKISGISCRLKHRKNEWGDQSNTFDRMCNKEDYDGA